MNNSDNKKVKIWRRIWKRICAYYKYLELPTDFHGIFIVIVVVVGITLILIKATEPHRQHLRQQIKIRKAEYLESLNTTELLEDE